MTQSSVRADLHTHSTASDGLDSPAALVQLASERGISVLALADHDTISGVEEAIRTADRIGIRCIPAVEFSIRAFRGQTHILGYGIDTRHPQLLEVLDALRIGRAERGWKVAECLRNLGITLPDEAFTADRDGGSPGRPHIARWLIRTGNADSIQDAFDRYLAVGRPAFVPRRTLEARRALEVIAGAGGIAVLAHPLSVYELEHVLPDFVEAGLAGLEAYYGEYRAEERRDLARLAARFDLLVTGGSDYHGPPEHRGRVLGSVIWPENDLNAFVDRLG